MKTKSLSVINILDIISLIVTLVMNGLSQFLPINGVTPKEVSDRYPNLFTPAPITFAIWGVIYLLLIVYILYRSGVFCKESGTGAYERVGVLFIVSCVFNVAWIFCWHYYLIPLSLVCMTGLLVTLIWAFVRITSKPLTLCESLTLKLPFAVYLGWITVAFVSNVSATLVSVGWDGFGVSEEWWTVIVLIIGAVIGLSVILTRLSWGYGAAMIWAYIGIVIKHVSADGFDGKYPKIIAVAAVAALILLAASVYAAVKYTEVLTESTKTERT